MNRTINKNKGMFIEKLVNQTIKFYIENKICFIEKRYLPIEIIKRDKNKVLGKLLNKSYVDYCGILEKKYVCFETKQTDNDEFLLNQIKKHQLDHLKDIVLYGGYSFLVLHFFNHDETYLIPYKELEKLYTKKIKRINLEQLRNNDKVASLNIVFPGILDLYQKIKNLVIPD